MPPPLPFFGAGKIRTQDQFSRHGFTWAILISRRGFRSIILGAPLSFIEDRGYMCLSLSHGAFIAIPRHSQCSGHKDMTDTYIR